MQPAVMLTSTTSQVLAVLIAQTHVVKDEVVNMYQICFDVAMSVQVRRYFSYLKATATVGT